MARKGGVLEARGSHALRRKNESTHLRQMGPPRPSWGWSIWVSNVEPIGVGAVTRGQRRNQREGKGGQQIHMWAVLEGAGGRERFVSSFVLF